MDELDRIHSIGVSDQVPEGTIAYVNSSGVCVHTERFSLTPSVPKDAYGILLSPLDFAYWVLDRMHDGHNAVYPADARTVLH